MYRDNETESIFYFNGGIKIMLYKKDIKSLWEKSLEEAFEQTVKNDKQILMDILSLVVFNRFNSNIGKLYSILDDLESFTKIIDAFSDQMFKFPNKDEFKQALVLALVYYFKEIKKMNWIEVQKQIPYEKDIPIHYGKKIVSLHKEIKKQIQNLTIEK